MAEDLQSIVQKMIDAGEPEESIASVIKEYNRNNPIVSSTKPEPEPSTFWGGVKKSLTSGEAANAGLEGGLGYLKGATLDIPGSILGGIQSIGNLIQHPIDTLSGVPGGIRNMWDTTTKAGGDPDAFGRMMGQMTGQSLVLGELAPRGIKAAAPKVGAGMEFTGDLLHRYQPTSGMLPRFADMRTLRNLERYAGKKLSGWGQELQVPTKNGIPVGPAEAAVKDGEILQDALPESKTTQYGQSSNEARKALTGKTEMEPSSFSKDYKRLGELIDKEKMGTLTGEELKEARVLDKKLRDIGFKEPVAKTVTEIEKDLAKKPKIRANTDGSFTNLDTGETFTIKEPYSNSKPSKFKLHTSPFIKD